MIKAKDPRLRRISVAYEGFIVPESVPLPKYSQLTEALPVASLAEAAPFSPPVIQVEEEEEAEQEEGGSVDLALATDGYEVFDQSTPSPNYPEDMGSRGSPNAISRNYWRANLEGGRLEGPPNQNFLPPPPLLNLLLVPLSHFLPLGLNNLTLKGEGSLRARR